MAIGLTGLPAAAQTPGPDQPALGASDAGAPPSEGEPGEPGSDQAPEDDAGTAGPAPIDITADTLEYERGRDLYVAQGNVHIRQPSASRTLTADWVAFNNTTRKGVASGNVVLTQGPDTLKADFLQFDIDTLKGVVFDGTLDSAGTGFRMEGGEVRRTGDETYSFRQATFTTCRCPQEGREPWTLRASQADIEVGGYAVARNSSVAVLGIPVLWLPWMIYPVKSERQSGFLFPSFGSSSRSGFEVGLPFFWAARYDLNLTFTPTWIGQRGFLGEADGEYVFGDHSGGKFRLAYVPDDHDVNPDDPSTPFNSRRWGAIWEHDQELPWNTRLRIDANLVSDNEFPSDFRGFRKYDNDRFMPSIASLTKQFGGANPFGISADVQWADDLQSPDNVDRDPFLLQRLPAIHATEMASRLPFADLFVTSFDVRYANFWNRRLPQGIFEQIQPSRNNIFLDTGIDALPDGNELNQQGDKVTLNGEIVAPNGTVTTAADVDPANPLPASAFSPDQSLDDFPPGPEGDGVFQEGEPLADRGHRLIVNPRVAMPLHFGPLEVYPEVGYHGTFYHTIAQDFAERSLGTARLDLSARLRRAFDLPLGLGEGVHLLEPRLSYVLVSSFDQSDNPLFTPRPFVPQDRVRTLELENVLRDMADRIDRYNGVVASVENRIFTRPAGDGEGPRLAPRLVADVSAAVSYEVSGNQLGDYVMEGTLYPRDNVDVHFNLGVDLDPVQFAEGLFDVGWSSPAGHDFRLAYRYIRDIPRFFEDFKFDKQRFDEFKTGFTHVNQLQLSTRWAVTANWALSYYMTYAFEQSLFLGNAGAVEYISQCKCWATRVTADYDRARGVEVRLEYRIIGLGDDTVRPFQ